MTNHKIISRTAVRTFALSVATAACAVSLGACSSSGGAGASSTPTIPAADPATSSSAGATAGSPTTTATTTVTTSVQAAGDSGSGATAQSSASGYCAESQLRATIDSRHVPGNGTTDSAGRTMKGFYVDFENTSSSSCVLYGYPGAATENSSNKQQQQARRTLSGPLGGLQKAPTRVTLAPGARAAAMIEGVDKREQGAAQAGCDATTPRILITPPNTRVAVPFAITWGVCFSLDVHPVQRLS